jgi:hypothetical protein
MGRRAKCRRRRKWSCVQIRTELSGETTNRRYFEGYNYSFAVAMIVGYWYFC